MTRDEIVSEIRDRCGADVVDLYDKSAKRVWVEIRGEALVRVARYLFHERGARFNIASGVDTPAHIEILYHFTLESIDLVVTLRVKLNKDTPEVDSLTPSFEAANWIEREIHELLGVTFRGHPDPRRLLLPEQWPEGVYPLRQDYVEWDRAAIRDRGV